MILRPSVGSNVYLTKTTFLTGEVNMKNLAFLFAFIFLKTSCAHGEKNQELPPLRTVPQVDLNLYVGKWFEIARFDQSFQKNCVGSTAFYSLREDGDIDVLNECHIKTLDGPIKSSKGRAVIQDKITNAKLKVTFFWPFYGKYWIIDLGKDYKFAVVGHPNRKYLWILSRTQTMSNDVYQGIIRRLKNQYYDVSKLIVEPSTLAQ